MTTKTDDVAAISIALENLKDFVRKKTRFEPDDIQLFSGQSFKQTYTINSYFALSTKDISCQITARFIVDDNSNKEQISQSSLGEALINETNLQLKTAYTSLVKAVENSPSNYKPINSGIYLQPRIKYFYLNGCKRCAGTGEQECATCLGRRTVTCYSCHGDGRVQCNCNNGKVTCYVCGGSGTKAYYPSSDLNNVQYISCTSCSNGSLQCNLCYGQGSVVCSTCGGGGRINCRTCLATGKVRCEPCAGTGEVGEAYWSEVHADLDDEFTLPEDSDETVHRIVNKENKDNLVSISSGFQLTNIDRFFESKNSLISTYSGQFTFVKLSVRCGIQEYEIIAYGSDLKWLSLDTMIEDIVAEDLADLQRTLVERSNDSIFETKTDELLEKLSNVVASEITVDLLDSTYLNQHIDRIVSADFATTIKNALLSAIRLIFMRLAKRICLWLLMLVILLSLIAWAFFGKYLGVATGISAAVLSKFGLDFFAVSEIKKSVNDFTDTDRIVRLTQINKWASLPSLLVTVPSILFSIAIISYLPDIGIWQSSIEQKATNKFDSETPSSDIKHVNVEAGVVSQTPQKAQRIDKVDLSRGENSQIDLHSLKPSNESKPITKSGNNLQSLNIKPINTKPSLSVTPSPIASRNPTGGSHESNHMLDDNRQQFNNKDGLNSPAEDGIDLRGLEIRPITVEEVEERKKNCPIAGAC